jgi:hypothetical protein
LLAQGPLAQPIRRACARVLLREQEASRFVNHKNCC